MLDSPDGIKHTIDVFMLARYESGEPTKMTLDENLNEMGFFSLAEVQAMAVSSGIEPRVATRQLLQDWQNGFQNTNGLYLGKYGNAVIGSH